MPVFRLTFSVFGIRQKYTPNDIPLHTHRLRHDTTQHTKAKFLLVQLAHFQHRKSLSRADDAYIWMDIDSMHNPWRMRLQYRIRWSPSFTSCGRTSKLWRWKNVDFSFEFWEEGFSVGKITVIERHSGSTNASKYSPAHLLNENPHVRSHSEINRMNFTQRLYTTAFVLENVKIFSRSS